MQDRTTLTYKHAALVVRDVKIIHTVYCSRDLFSACDQGQRSSQSYVTVVPSNRASKGCPSLREPKAAYIVNNNT